LRYLHPRHGAIRFQANTFSRELIDYREDAERMPVGQFVAHQVHAPALIPARRPRRRQALSPGHLPPLLGAHDQLFLGIQPVDAFRIHFPALASQQHGQPAIAIAYVRSRQLAQPPPQYFVEAPHFLFVQPGRPCHSHQARGSTLPDLEGLLGPLSQLSSQPGR